MKRRIFAGQCELAGALLRWFVGREDRIAVSNGRGFSPEELLEPLSAERLASEHLAGQRSLAFYIMRSDNTVMLSCLDFDNKPERPDPELESKVSTIVECLRRHQIDSLVERSQSGRGAHLWIFFDQPQPAWFVRSFWRGVLRHLSVREPEIFPRQDELGGKRLGNPIRYPLFNQSCFVEPQSRWKSLDAIRALRGIVPVSTENLAEAADSMDFLIAEPRRPMSIQEWRGSTASEVSQRVQELLSDQSGLLARRWHGDTMGMQDGSRSALVAAIACQLVWKHVPTDDIASALVAWCRQNGYEKGQRPDWLVGVMQSAYRFVWNSDDERKLRKSLANQSFPDLTTDQQRLVRRKLARQQSNQN